MPRTVTHRLQRPISICKRAINYGSVCSVCRELLLFSASDVGDYVQASVMIVLQGGDSYCCHTVHTHCGGCSLSHTIALVCGAILLSVKNCWSILRAGPN